MTRDRAGGRRARPCGGHRNSDRARGPYSKKGRAGRPAVAAAKPREPAGEPATLQKLPELLLDEAGQAFPVAQAGGLRAKGLEVIAHDLVEHTLRGTPRFVARRGRDHSRPEGGRRANAGLEEIGLNSRAREPQVADIAVLASGVIAVLATRNEAFLTLPTEMRLP